jgi:CRP-like cAMP-binding protein
MTDDSARSVKGCYVVRSGHIHLPKAVGQSQKQLAICSDGDLIGEIELLYGTPRIAGALASTATSSDLNPSTLDLRYF